MCDTLCVLGSDGLRFAKNSDRPPGEPQVVLPFPSRGPGIPVHTQYRVLPDPEAAGLIGSRPDWLWGFEHGINEHRVAIGNEKIWTVDDPAAAPDALIGMDLVRLGLERGTTADDALDAVTGLLDTVGQGGVADATVPEAYWSSFLIADPSRAWILETSGNRWVAAPVADGAAISNRVSLRTEWTRASVGVARGTDVDSWRDPLAPTAIGDLRLAVTRECVAHRDVTARDLVATLRHHGDRAWGAPGSAVHDVSLPPTGLDPDFTGISVCMHVRDLTVTTASMVTELPLDPDRPARAWFALGAPCASVFVPAFPPTVGAALGSEKTWRRFDELRGRVESDGESLRAVRAEFGPVEAELWDAADAIAARPAEHRSFTRDAFDAVHDALLRLGVA